MLTPEDVKRIKHDIPMHYRQAAVEFEKGNEGKSIKLGEEAINETVKLAAHGACEVE